MTRKIIAFYYDNAIPHASLATRQKLMEFGWDVLSLPARLPDLETSDFNLLNFLQNSLHEITLNSDDVVNQHLFQLVQIKTDPSMNGHYEAYRSMAKGHQKKKKRNMHH